MLVRILKGGFFVAGALYLTLFFTLFFAQRELMYPGRHMHLGQRTLQQVKVIASEHELHLWHDHSGNYLGLARLTLTDEERSQDCAIAWLHFHGNGDTALYSAGFFHSAFEPHLAPLKADYYSLEYPGYGARAGETSEKILFQVADEAMDELTHAGYDLFIVSGVSLGSGVATYVASRHPEKVKALILITPFDSMVSAAENWLTNMLGPMSSLFPLEIMMQDHYRSTEYLQNYHGPLLICSSANDPVTPAWMGENLIQRHSGTKQLFIQDNDGHWVDLSPRRVPDDLFDFFWKDFGAASSP